MARWAAALKGVLPGRSGKRDNPPRAEADQKTGSPGADMASEGEANALAYAPVVWLLGKVQSGKTSVIRAITGSSDAEIGDGFRPCTRTARLYAFPTDTPVLRFLDTRGLGEADYDATDDLAFSEQAAHLVLATVRAMDTDQSALFDALQQVRVRHPNWPIVVAQTSLHDAYRPGECHTLPYPFEPGASPDVIARIPTDLMRALAHQRTLFDKLPGRGGLLFVPVDLTKPSDGLPPADYGLDALTEALATVAPAGMLAALSAMPGFKADPKARSADPIVMGHAMAAAGGDLVPIPVAGAIAASTIQARMLSQLGRLYGVEWDKRAYAELTAAIGAGTVAKVAAGVGLRQLAKLLPVYGQTAGAAASAAASFAVTYALGKAAVYYLHGRRLGTTDRGGIAEAYQQALREAFRMARERKAAEQSREARPMSDRS
ncbi:DUF697 domain-containing protein [Hyphomicrobium sp.]|uniref:YcjF family protein n=1 Tax=Hyphomicrobium sp. TaxID=82 RepID=UPI0025C3DD5E|nr:DUF697 domain-containing protein [Hyphomicrobium sp.]MCC7251442.1 DUF697 domain-containing protein [Hyphomicrobium sp.]